MATIFLHQTFLCHFVLVSINFHGTWVACYFPCWLYINIWWNVYIFYWHIKFYFFCRYIKNFCAFKMKRSIRNKIRKQKQKQRSILFNGYKNSAFLLVSLALNKDNNVIRSLMACLEIQICNHIFSRWLENLQKHKFTLKQSVHSEFHMQVACVSG